MTAPTDVTLRPDDLNDTATKLPDAQQSTSEAQDAMLTMDGLPEAGATSDAQGKKSLADANAARGGNGDGGGGGAAGCGDGANANAATADAATANPGAGDADAGAATGTDAT